MATELKPGAVAGLDERQAQALKRAGVDTVERLAAIDAEAMARQTGLSAADLAQMKEKAATLLVAGQRRPVRRFKPVAWVMVALILIAALAVLYAARVRAGMGARLAEQEQKLVAAASRVAADGLARVDAAASDAAGGNWGLAQRDLNRAGEEITFLERIVPRSLVRDVAEARSHLGRAQEAVGRQDESASQRVAELRKVLARLAGEEEPPST